MERARRPGPSVRLRVRELRDGGEGPGPVTAREDRVVTEEPLEVRLARPGRPATRVATTMRTPGHDFELAVGLLHAEGLLDPQGLESVAYCTSGQQAQLYNVVTVTGRGTHEARPPAELVTGVSSACGICGDHTIEEVLAHREAAQTWSGSVPAAVVRGAPERVRAQQRVFDSTGGLHAAALLDASGEVLVLREDVGRHNAVDKVVGARLLAAETTALPLLCTTGRLGFEIVQKAAAAGIGVVAGIGAPTSLAVELAERAGLGLAGFVSAGRLVVYAGAGRIEP